LTRQVVLFFPECCSRFSREVVQPARTYVADECFSFVNADVWIQPLDVKSFACCRWFHMRNPIEEISNVMQSDPAYGELFDARGLEDLLR
jgi:hypothetical protein